MNPRPALRHLPLLLSLLLAGPALSMGLGDATVRSYLGAPLRVEISLRSTPDETVDEQCIGLGTPVNDGTAALGLRLRILEGIRRTLLVESARAVTEPFATIRIRLDCGGTALMRDYALLIDPNPLAPSAGFTAVPAAVATALAPAGTLAPAAPAVDAAAAAPPGGREKTASRRQPPRDRMLATVKVADAAHLRLDLGRNTANHLPGPGLALEQGRNGIGLLRLEGVFAPPTGVTTDLVARREQLRDLRALLLSDDGPIDRVLALQGQVSALEIQLHGLQARTPTSDNPADAGARPAGAPALAGTAARPTITVPAGAPGGSGTPDGGPLPHLQAHTGGPDAAALMLWAAAASAAALVAAGALLIWRRRPSSSRAEIIASVDQDLASALLADPRNDAIPYPKATTRRPTAEPRRASREDAPHSTRRAAAIAAVATLPAAGGAQTAVIGAAGASANATGAPGETEQAARAAYLASRFPEVGAGLIRLSDPESIVNGARLYVDHGDPDRARELLETALQGDSSGDVRPWLALFELHRLRHEVSPFVLLLARFRAAFATSRYIPEILAAGRQLDPTREEFRPPAGSAVFELPSEGTTWLNPELDFVPQALAQELHDTLMAELAEDAGDSAGWRDPALQRGIKS